MPDQAVAVYDPALAGRELAEAIEHRRPQLAALLGYEADSERGKAMLDRFVTVALHAATRPEILRATKESLVEAIRDSAMLGLEPVGATGDGAIVIYNEKVKRERPSTRKGAGPTDMVVYEETVPVAQFQPMYRGLLKLARRSDQLAHIDAHVVYQGDEIDLDLGSNPIVKHYPVLDGARRGEVVGAYAVAELTNGRRYVEWMTTADIEVVRRSSRARTSGPWVTFWTEMARKTVLRRLMKRLPLETMAEHAMRLESEAEERAVAPVSQPAESSDARRRLRSRFVSDGADEADVDSSGSEPTETAPEGESGVSVVPTGSESNIDGSDVVDGDVREAPALGASPPGRCGAAAPIELGFAEGTICVLEPGHAFPDGKPTAHQDEGGSRWPNTAK